MRVHRLVFAALALLVGAGSARANSLLDPGVIIKGGGGSFSVGTTFSLPNVGANATLDLINNQAGTVPFLNLLLTFSPGAGANGLPPSAFNCQALAFFANCAILQFGSLTTPTIVLFSGGTGIGLSGDFEIVINGFASNTGVTGVANVPEPATMSLLLLGAGAVALRRRRMIG